MFVAREIKQTLLHKFGKVFFYSPFIEIDINIKTYISMILEPIWRKKISVNPFFHDAVPE